MSADKKLIEKRSGPDRRKRTIPPLKYIFLGGRRKRVRRKEDEQRLVIFDTHGPMIFALAALILTLSIVDAINTLNLVGAGATETNPFMSFLIDINPYLFFFVKSLLAIIGIILLIIFRNYRSKLFRVKLSKFFPAFALVFMVVIIYQFYLMFS